PFRFPPEKALSFIAQRENRLSGVPQDVFDQVRTQLEDGISDGDSIENLSTRVRETFNNISKARSRTIAMTETAAAYGESRQEAMEQSGVGFKKWLTSGNENVRDAHQEANGQIVAVNEHFTVGGESLIGPGDPHGSPGNVINCHCVAIAVTKESE